MNGEGFMIEMGGEPFELTRYNSMNKHPNGHLLNVVYEVPVSRQQNEV